MATLRSSASSPPPGAGALLPRPFAASLPNHASPPLLARAGGVSWAGEEARRALSPWRNDRGYPQAASPAYSSRSFDRGIVSQGIGYGPPPHPPQNSFHKTVGLYDMGTVTRGSFRQSIREFDHMLPTPVIDAGSSMPRASRSPSSHSLRTRSPMPERQPALPQAPNSPRSLVLQPPPSQRSSTPQRSISPHPAFGAPSPRRVSSPSSGHHSPSPQRSRTVSAHSPQRSRPASAGQSPLLQSQPLALPSPRRSPSPQPQAMTRQTRRTAQRHANNEAAEREQSEKVVTVTKEVPVDRIVEVEKIVEKFVPVEVPSKTETKIVVREVEVPVEIKVPYPVERVVEQTVIKEVEVIREVPVVVERLVEKIVTKEVPVERIVYRELPADAYIERSKYEALEREVRRLQELLQGHGAPPHVATASHASRAISPQPASPASHLGLPGVGTRVSHSEFDASTSPVGQASLSSQPKFVLPASPGSPLRASPIAQAPLSHAATELQAMPAHDSVVKMVGLGISLARGAEDVSTFVTGTIPGYAAHTSGQVCVNDVLEHVDDIAVQDLSLEQIKRLTVGPENTVCALSIRRGDQRMHVHLVRRGAEPL